MLSVALRCANLFNDVHLEHLAQWCRCCCDSDMRIIHMCETVCSALPGVGGILSREICATVFIDMYVQYCVYWCDCYYV